MARTSKAARRRLQRILGLGLLAATLEFTAFAALAGDCPGNPDALGTSRTLVVDPREHPRIGTMQYQETLPLRDHEVVLTFDDGPLPPHSLRVLDILAHECVKATFFTVGRMARDYPQHLRRVLAAGHSIGTHSQNHPLGMNRMSIERARQEIDDGIASATAALGDEAALAPFMRIPGLRRAQGIEDYLASRNIQLWSADFPADDWRPISAERVYQLAISRIEAKGKGILLLHDIQARTVAALPRILRMLKERGYRIVHVVPATANRPKTATEPKDWRVHPVPATVAAVSPSPAVQAPNPAEAGTLPASVIPDTQLPIPTFLRGGDLNAAATTGLSDQNIHRRMRDSVGEPRESEDGSATRTLSRPATAHISVPARLSPFHVLTRSNGSTSGADDGESRIS